MQKQATHGRNTKSPLISFIEWGLKCAHLVKSNPSAKPCVSVEGGAEYYSWVPPGDFPVEDGGSIVKWIQTVYFPELCKPSVALHKVKVKEPNLLYRFTQLSAAVPHIWRLPISDTEICCSWPMPHGVLCCIFQFHLCMKGDYDKWAGSQKDVSSFDNGEPGKQFLLQELMHFVKHNFK